MTAIIFVLKQRMHKDDINNSDNKSKIPLDDGTWNSNFVTFHSVEPNDVLIGTANRYDDELNSRLTRFSKLSIKQSRQKPPTRFFGLNRRPQLVVQDNNSGQSRRPAIKAADDSSDEDVGEIVAVGMSMSRNIPTSGTFKPAVYRDCPPLPLELKTTHYSFLLDQNVPFKAVVQEMTKCLAKISDYKFVNTPSEKSWLGKMEIPGVVISHVKLNIYCSHEPITRTAPLIYTIEARRILGDIPAFYSFVRELHVKLSNKPATYNFDEEETEDLNEELIAQCAHGDASFVRRMLALPQVDPTRYNKNGTTALHMICHHGHQHLFTLLMEVKNDKMDLYLRASNTGRTPMETALDNKQMDFLEFAHETHNVPLPEGFYAYRPAVAEMETMQTYETAASRALAASGLANPNLAPEPVIQPARALEEKRARFRLLTGKEPPIAALDRRNFIFDDPSDRSRHEQQVPPLPQQHHKRSAGNDTTSEPVDQPKSASSTALSGIHSSSSSNNSSSIGGRFQEESSSELQFDDEEAEFMRQIAERGPPPPRSQARSQPMGGLNVPAPPLLKLSSTGSVQTTDDTTSIVPNAQPNFTKGDNVQPHSQSVTPDLIVEPVTKSAEETLVKQRGHSSEDDVLNAMFLPNSPTADGAHPMSVQDESGADADQSDNSQHMLQSLEGTVLMKTDTTASSPAGYGMQRDLRSTDSDSESDLECDADKSDSDSEDGTKSMRVVESPTTAVESCTVKIQSDWQIRCDSQSLVTQMLDTIDQYAAYYVSNAPKTKLNRQITRKCIETVMQISAEEMKLPLRSRSQTALNACTSLDRVSLIHLAAGMNDTDLLSALLENNANVNLRDGNNQTALHIAARYNNYDAAKLLLSHKDICIDILDSTPVSPMSPLHIAAQFGHIEIVKLLSERNTSHLSFIKIRTPIHWAASEGRSGMCSELIASGFAEVDAVDALGDTALIVAAKSAGKWVTNSAKQQQCFDAMNVLLLHNASVDVFNSDARTVLHYISDEFMRRRVADPLVRRLFAAVRDNDVTTVTMMLNMGVSVDYTLDRSLDTALHLACRQSDEEVIVRLLEAGANANAQNHLGFTSLICAAQRGSLSIVKLLMQTGPNVMLTDSHGRTAMHYAAMAGHVDVLKSLLLPNIVTINATTHLHTSVLSAALVHDKLECVDFLYSCGAAAKHCDAMGRSVDSFIPLRELTKSPAQFHAELHNSTSSPLRKVPDPQVVKIFKRDAHAHLYHASIHNCVDRVKYIVDSLRGRININQRVEDRQQTKSANGEPAWNVVYETALYGAVIRGHTAVVLFLLAEGANATIPSRNGWAPIYAASKKNLPEIVNMLVRAPNVDVNCKNSNDMTSLNIAAYMGYTEVCRILLENGADPNVGDKLGARPLHAAVQNLNRPIIDMLLERNADVNAITTSGISPLYVAAFNGHADVAEKFIKLNADVNCANFEGLTPLHVSAFNGHKDCCEQLLKAGARVNHAEKNNVTALYAACQKGHLDIVRLLKSYGADISHRIVPGNSPLHTAAIDGNVEIVKQLIEWNADIDARNADQATAFYTAAEKGHFEILNLLHNTGKVDINAVNSSGVTPLNIASQNGHLDVVERLLELNAEVDIQSNSGPSALFVAAQKGHTEIVRALLSKKPQMECMTNYGETAVFVSAYSGYLDITKMLIDAGASLDVRDVHGRTALWLAAKNGLVDIIEALINGGADVTIPNNDGITPAQIAKTMKRHNVLSRLLCSICSKNQRDCVYLPCKHTPHCAPCSRSVNECPICDTEIAYSIPLGVNGNALASVRDASDYTAQAVNRLHLNMSARVCSCNELVIQHLVAPFFELPLWEWWAVVEPQVNAAADPANAVPVAVEPAAADPANAVPVAVEPAAADPANAVPVAVEPAAADPANAAPVAVEPAAADPANAAPVAVEPATVGVVLPEPDVPVPDALVANDDQQPVQSARANRELTVMPPLMEDPLPNTGGINSFMQPRSDY